MPLSPGTPFGPYDVIAKLGEGGMGEVYRARDPRLGRDVALKVLPMGVMADPDRLSRLEREARVLASLNHPHIGGIHGVEDSGPARALVMELVEGPTLADLLATGALPLDEAIRISRQITDALAAAHEQGIVHRDLKPANVKVRTDGTVKVLDFGLAKAVGPTEGAVGPPRGAVRPARGGHDEESPTITSPALTQVGVILGTAAYMSPEQARGRPVDKRADIWAFGCVLYEMVSGTRPFGGADVAETLAAVLKDSPRYDRVPARVRPLVIACLQKDPRERLRDIGDAWRLLADDPAAPAGAHAAPRRSWLIPLSAAVTAAVVSASGSVAYFRSRPEPPPPVAARFTLRSSPNTVGRIFLSGLSLSPDGTRIVFRKLEDQVPRRAVLSVRALDSLDAVVLPGTQSANFPAWSPDGRSLIFFSDGKLRRVDLGGGPPIALADAPEARGAAWNRNGVVLFGSRGSLMRVASAGGIPEPVIADDGVDPLRGFPQFLPDGDRFLYLSSGDKGTQLGIYASSLSRPEQRRFVVATGFQATYVPPFHGSPGDETLGHLLYMRDDTLLAQPFDVDALRLVGEPTPIANGVTTAINSREAAFHASNSGVLAYGSTSVMSRAVLRWLDRSGKPLGDVAPEDYYSSLRISPDGSQVVIGRRNAAGSDDQWLFDLTRPGSERLTFDPTRETYPVWSPDGTQIAFASNAAGTYQLHRMPAGGGASQQLTNVTGMETVTDWSRDGRFALYTQRGARTGSDIWLWPMMDAGGPVPVVQTPSAEGGGRFSPDGRWIAYMSDESGRPEVYVQGFPTPGRRVQVSTSGGNRPLWRKDGREIFFNDQRGIVAAEIGETAGRIAPGPVRRLFDLALTENLAAPFDVSADGQRFLVLVGAPSSGEAEFVVLTNWQTTLRAR